MFTFSTSVTARVCFLGSLRGGGGGGGEDYFVFDGYSLSKLVDFVPLLRLMILFKVLQVFLASSVFFFC